jgi:uncharacterized repeat protein (TIGR03803 family)
MVRLFDSGKCVLYCCCALVVSVAAANAAKAKTETVLYSFQNNGADGNVPTSNLIDVKGMLYGTTEYGGVSDVGTVYSINPSTGSETVLYSFRSNGADGNGPTAGLININGTLYGTTFSGGVSGGGTVYSIDPSTGTEKVVYSFQNNSADGVGPHGDLIDLDGTLFGTTIYGGSAGDGGGTIFSIDLSTGAESVLHSFSSEDQGGLNPLAGLTDVDGTLYGTAPLGGQFADGVVFSIDPSTGAYSVLYSFRNNGDGNAPESDLIDVGGTLYGTTFAGGGTGCSREGCGTVFSVNPSTGSESVLYAFKNSGGDGTNPIAGPIDVNGKLYGTTEVGGADRSGCNGKGCGTVFAIDLKTVTEKVLYSFKNEDGDGILPVAALIKLDGALYSTTAGGGAQNEGTVFKVKL